ncbi:13597_t:CDS:2, partial [Gigaspora rosea]
HRILELSLGAVIFWSRHVVSSYNDDGDSVVSFLFANAFIIVSIGLVLPWFRRMLN